MATYAVIAKSDFGHSVVLNEFEANNVIDAIHAVSLLFPKAELYARVRKEGTEDTDTNDDTKLREDAAEQFLRSMDHPSFA